MFDHFQVVRNPFALFLWSILSILDLNACSGVLNYWIRIIDWCLLAMKFQSITKASCKQSCPISRLSQSNYRQNRLKIQEITETDTSCGGAKHLQTLVFILKKSVLITSCLCWINFKPFRFWNLTHLTFESKITGSIFQNVRSIW